MPRAQPIDVDMGRCAYIHKSGEQWGFRRMSEAVDAFLDMPKMMQVSAWIEVRGPDAVYRADQVQRLHVALHQA